MRTSSIAAVLVVMAGPLSGCEEEDATPPAVVPVSYTHLTLPTIYSV